MPRAKIPLTLTERTLLRVLSEETRQPFWIYLSGGNWRLARPTLLNLYTSAMSITQTELKKLKSLEFVALGDGDFLPAPFERLFGSTIDITDKGMGAVT